MRRANTTCLIVLVFMVSFILYSCSSINYGRLLTWEEYVEHPRTDPYILELDKKGGSLFYYGAFHKVDPEDPQFEDIEQKWPHYLFSCP